MWRLSYENDELIVEASGQEDKLKIELKEGSNGSFPDDPFTEAVLTLLSTVTVIEHLTQKRLKGKTTKKDEEILKKIIEFLNVIKG